MTMTIRVGIIGCGAIGSRLALELANPDRVLCLYDHDKVADDNIGTSAYSRYDIGKQKAWALAAMVATRKGQAEALHQDILRKPIRDTQGFNLIVDCLDNAKARNYLDDLAHGYDIVHVGVAEGVGEVMWGRQSYHADAGVHVCTHMLGRNIICLTASVAALAIERFLLDAYQKNYMVNSNGKVMF